MVGSILFIVLFILVCSGILYFIFKVLLPSLSAQKIDVTEPLFSKEETESLTVKTHFAHLNTGKRAIVISPNKRDADTFSYDSRLDCNLFASLYERDSEKDNGCIGLGSCVKICTKDAIKIQDRTAVITSSCNGCGLCVSCCPKNFIKLVSIDSKEFIDYENDAAVKSSGAGQKDLQFWQKCYNIVKRK